MNAESSQKGLFWMNRKNMQKAQQLIIHSSPLALGIVVSYLFWRSNMLLLALYLLAVLFLILSGKDKKVESWIVLYGMVTGLIIEGVGTSVSGYQSFAQPDIFGIPYWLVVVWGYGFLLMKRVSLIIATESPWAR